MKHVAQPIIGIPRETKRVPDPVPGRNAGVRPVTTHREDQGVKGQECQAKGGTTGSVSR